jgi:hypothetical protein
MRSGAWREHAPIAEERIEDAGYAAGERDDRDVFATPDRDPEGPGPQGIGYGESA